MSQIVVNLPWIEKYRPQSLSDIYDHNNKIQALKYAVKHDALPHLLFYGPPGTGKTSTILALAREMYGSLNRKYILELNASEDRGIEIVRTKIPDFINIKSDRVKLIILDEAESMTVEAQAALNRLIESQSQYCRFCLICNDICKIKHGIQSRCTKIRFGRLERNQIREKVNYILECEKMKIEQKALDFLINEERDMRQVINILNSLKNYSKNSDQMVTYDELNDFLDLPTVSDIKNILNEIQDDKYISNISELNNYIEQLLSLSWSTDVLLDRIVRYFVQESGFKIDKSFIDMVDKICDIKRNLDKGNSKYIVISSLSLAFYRYFHAKKTISKIKSSKSTGSTGTSSKPKAPVKKKPPIGK